MKIKVEFANLPLEGIRVEDIDFESGYGGVLDEYFSAMNDDVRRMLGLWVSELEPALVYTKRGDLVGLTIADLPIGSETFIVIPARGVTIKYRSGPN